MKSNVFIALVLFLFFSIPSISQNKDLTDSLPGKERTDDFSNKKQIDVSSLLNFYSKLKSSTLVILNNTQILTIDEKYFTSLPKDSIISINVVNDEKSKTPIKHILFISAK